MRTFVVAGNWDKDLIDGLAKHKEVGWVFAKLGTDATGGGRAAFVIPKLSRKRAEDYVSYCRSKGIKFNYLYNAACLGNMEFSKEGRKKLIKELEWAIYEAKVDGVTVATNYLFNLIRKRYPELKVGVGIFMRMGEIDRFKYFNDLGASWITVGFNICRDFKLMKKLRKAVNCDLHVFTNNICLYSCPHVVYHPNVLTHMSKHHSQSAGVCVDYHTWTCNKIKLDTPEELLKSRWIRPEDLHIYEDMGYTHFKITDRSRATRWLLRTVDAYVNRKWDGNLSDILSLEIPGDEKNIQPEVNRRFRQLLLKKGVSEQVWLKGSFGWGKRGRPFINNRDLDGMMKFFEKANCEITDCDKCGYCKELADKAIYFPDEEAHQRLRNVLGASVDAFLQNKLFEPKNENKLESKVKRTKRVAGDKTK